MNIHAELSAFNNLRSQTEESAGQILWIEFKMRYLAERSQKIVDELDKITASKKEDQKYYWNCKLDDLLKAIGIAFHDQLSEKEIDTLQQYQMVRNRFLHSNFVDALKKLNLSTGGRQMLRNGERVPLERGEIGESLKAFHTNKGVRAVRGLTNSVEELLDRFLKALKCPNQDLSVQL